jgi:hypothetical protein
LGELSPTLFSATTALGLARLTAFPNTWFLIVFTPLQFLGHTFRGDFSFQLPDCSFDTALVHAYLERTTLDGLSRRHFVAST